MIEKNLKKRTEKNAVVEKKKYNLQNLKAEKNKEMYKTQDNLEGR